MPTRAGERELWAHDLKEDVTRREGLALLLLPLSNAALGHGGRPATTRTRKGLAACVGRSGQIPRVQGEAGDAHGGEEELLEGIGGGRGVEVCANREQAG